jgi:hypothetical protein
MKYDKVTKLDNAMHYCTESIWLKTKLFRQSEFRVWVYKHTTVSVI